MRLSYRSSHIMPIEDNFAAVTAVLIKNARHFKQNLSKSLDPGYFKTEKIYYLHIVPEEVAPVFVFQLFTRQQWKHKVFWCPE